MGTDGFEVATLKAIAAAQPERLEELVACQAEFSDVGTRWAATDFSDDELGKQYAELLKRFLMLSKGLSALEADAEDCIGRLAD